MNPFSVVSYCQNNLGSLPSIPSVLLQRRSSSSVVNVVVHTSPATSLRKHSQQDQHAQQTQLAPHHPHAPTITNIPEQRDEQMDDNYHTPAAITHKPRNNPQAILPELEKNEENFYLRFAEGHNAKDEGDSDNDSIVGDMKANRHSIHAFPVERDTDNKGERLSRKAILQRHASFHTVHTSLSSNQAPAPAPATTPVLARASMDSYDRARVLKPSPSDTMHATTMISQPRPMHLRHARSSSSPALVTSSFPSSFSLKKPLVPNASQTPLSTCMTHIPAGTKATPTSETEHEHEHRQNHEQTEDAAENEMDLEQVPEKKQSKLSPPLQGLLAEDEDEDEDLVSQLAISQALNFIQEQHRLQQTAAAAKASLLTSPSTPTFSPASTAKSAPLISTTSKPSSPGSPTGSPSHTMLTPIPSPAPSPSPSPSIISPSPTTTTPTPSSSFLSSWHGRSRSMIPTIPRPSPLLSFRAARSVVHSVTSVGTGLLPFKEQLGALQLGSIPVAGRILKHPVMDSTLSYIATKASERGISLSALTGVGLNSKNLILPEDVPYRKLNKKLIQQAMTLSILAVQKEEQSRAIDDEAGDDAFELYLAAINTLLHALPFETCDPLRREAFETQLCDFLEDQFKFDSKDTAKFNGSSTASSLLNDASASKRLRRRRRRRHREHHEQASNLIQQHTAVVAGSGDDKLQIQQRGQKKQQRKQRREQHAKEQQALKKLQLQQEKEREKEQKSKPHIKSAKGSDQRTTSQPQSQSLPHSRRRHRASNANGLPGLGHPQNTTVNSPAAPAPSGGLGDTIISTAVRSAIRLKQSPIPDVVKSCLRTSGTILSAVDERFHLQDKAWELSKQSIEKAIELDEQYAIHEVVTETVFATLTGLVKAGIAYKETPSYRTARATSSAGTLEGADESSVTTAAAGGARSHNPQGIQKAKKLQKDVKTKTKLMSTKENKHQQCQQQKSSLAKPSMWMSTASLGRRAPVTVESDSGSDSEANSEDSDLDSDEFESDSEAGTRSTLSSSTAYSSGSCSEDDEDEGLGESRYSDDLEEEEEELIELNQQTLRSTIEAQKPAGSTTPYTDQVREKIDMFMALKGAASLFYS